MKEVWKDINGYEGRYQISNLGRVKSFLRTEKILKLSYDRNKYLLVWLCKNGKQTVKKVHRLVGQYFIPNPDNLPCINHKDENPSNNEITNLEWCTYKYNNNYGTAKERKSKTLGKPVNQLSLSGEIVNTFYAAIEAQRRTGVANSLIIACCLGKRKTAGGYIWEYAQQSEVI